MDLSLGKVWEWVDMPATDEQISYIRKVVSSGETTLRINGSKYSDDRKLLPRELAGLNVVLEAMDWLEIESK